MKRKETTVDELASAVKGGFDDVHHKMDSGFKGVNDRLDRVDTRLDRIENLLLRDHLNRIERLEDDMRVLKTKTGVK